MDLQATHPGATPLPYDQRVIGKEADEQPRLFLRRGRPCLERGIESGDTGS